ncbi:MAG TPA: nickel pincer cofactor biosynthesis protein LarC [Candidatus Binatus sp.]|nr:nickel pincer cofactor biosynthesis protein LarC [Candidatus Binatus sp.]
MSIAFFDCFGGASGNMILGALADVGLDIDALERELRRLPVSGWTIERRPVHKAGLGALYLDVVVAGEDSHAADHHHEGHAHRSLADVLDIIRAARFAHDIEARMIAIFERLAAAEARVHRVPVDKIAFHEVGQIDAIVDVSAAVLGLRMLDVDDVFCSPLPCGRGTVRSAHGSLPSPSPATLDLLRDVPTYSVDLDAEMVTPTGAAILTSLASFGVRPPMTVERIGYGAGRSDFPFPNVLRMSIGQRARALGPVDERSRGNGRDSGTDERDAVQLETNIDDMSPQVYEHVLERLMASGALDVWLQSIQMKKGRPGTLLCVLAPPHLADELSDLMMAETTTIGVRRWPVQRRVAPRALELVATSFGPVRVKVITSPSGVRARAEYEDCREIAQRTGMPLVDVMRRIEAQLDEWSKQQT